MNAYNQFETVEIQNISAFILATKLPKDFSPLYSGLDSSNTTAAQRSSAFLLLVMGPLMALLMALLAGLCVAFDALSLSP